MKKILVPTDFSKCADNALEMAINLAKTAKAEVHLLHSADTVLDWNQMEFVTATTATKSAKEQHKLFPEIKARVGRANRQLETRKQRVKKAKIKVQTHLVYNLPKTGIADFAGEWKMDLIVMGTHGKSAFNQPILGSNTQRVTRKAPCPVLAVKKKPKKVMNIVYASDFSEPAMNKNLTRLRDFAEMLKATIHLLYVNTPNHFEDSIYSTAKMEKVAAKYQLKRYTVNVYNNFVTENGIVQFTDNTYADMIAMTTHGFSGLRRMMHYNITETVISEANVPVLCYNLAK